MPVTPRKPTQIPLKTARAALLPPCQVATESVQLAERTAVPVFPHATKEVIMRMAMVRSLLKGYQRGFQRDETR